MIKRLLLILAFFALTTSGFAQWTNTGRFPADGKTLDGHAVAVDPDGKVWAAAYGYADSLLQADGTWKKCRAIFVYNADGTSASFSPIKILEGAGRKDSLWWSTRGAKEDHEGNILFVTGWPEMYRIDYKTGAVLNYVDLSVAAKMTSPCAPAVDNAGNIYIEPVLPGEPVQMYDKDFNYIGNALDATTSYARTTEVSADGLDLYLCAYTAPGIYIYHRTDEFSAFEKVDSLMGFKTEGANWHPVTGRLWASSGAKGYADPGLFGNYQLTTQGYYEIDVANKTLTDSLFWVLEGADPAAERQRGISFSPDGNTAYIVAFGGSGYSLIQKVVKGAASTVDITFQVNMSIQAAGGNFNPATDEVKIAGSFNEWNNGANKLTDANSDLIYETTITLTPGTEIQYKFIKGAEGWESIDNRVYTVPGANATVTAYYNNVEVLGAPVTVTFSANMEYEIASGRFNPATDYVTVRGSFNGWSGDDHMTVSAGDPNFYEFTKEYTVSVGETWNYKYAYVQPSGTVIWEGDPNKTYTFTQDDITNKSAFTERVFNDLTGDNMLNNDVVVTFEVDMNGVLNGYTGQPFPSIKNVFIAGAVPPLTWPGGGWPDTDQDKVFFLFDDGTHGDAVAGDNKWSISLTFAKYSPLKIQYKFGANWALPENGGVNDNENQVGADHFLYLTPWILTAKVQNTFGVMGDILPVETTDVEKTGETPTTYELAQNYPNPFNPTTTINFSIPEAGFVTLKVYDILGKEVASLLNEDKSAGTYTVSFDASNLPTGTYIYKISAGNFTSTRKMLLLK